MVHRVPTAGGIFGPQVETGLGFLAPAPESTDWCRRVSVKKYGFIQAGRNRKSIQLSLNPIFDS